MKAKPIYKSASFLRIKNSQVQDNSKNVLTSLKKNALFINGLGDQGSIPGRVIPKTQKMAFDAALLNTWHYKVRCGSYWKGSLRVTLGKGCQLYFYF